MSDTPNMAEPQAVSWLKSWCRDFLSPPSLGAVEWVMRPKAKTAHVLREDFAEGRARQRSELTFASRAAEGRSDFDHFPDSPMVCTTAFQSDVFVPAPPNVRRCELCSDKLEREQQQIRFMHEHLLISDASENLPRYAEALLLALTDPGADA